MFSFITAPWNPLGGECLHRCGYCWARGLVDKFDMKTYTGPPTLRVNVLKNKVFTEKDFVFICDMNDLFGDWVPKDFIQRILDEAGYMSRATYLLLTKNPKRYLQFKLTENMVTGITLETNREYHRANAPSRICRALDFGLLNHKRKMVSIEPIMDFDFDEFKTLIRIIKPEFVAVGYDNYDHGLPEPPLDKTLRFIDCLENGGIKVYRKTLREANTGAL